jgi:hypothetical protein
MFDADGDDDAHAQVRRSSYHNVVRVQDVCKLMDVSGIQTYIINSSRVVFLNERPHPRGSKNEGKQQHKSSAKEDKPSRNSGMGQLPQTDCSFCHRVLQSDNNKYCSISCKVNGKECMIAKGGVDMSFAEETIKPTPRKSTQAKSKGDSKGGSSERRSPKPRDKSPVSDSSKQNVASPVSVKNEVDSPIPSHEASPRATTPVKSTNAGSLKRKLSAKDLKMSEAPVTPTLLAITPSAHRRKSRPKKSPVA